jgi:DNA-binding NtrC family response regulator
MLELPTAPCNVAEAPERTSALKAPAFTTRHRVTPVVLCIGILGNDEVSLRRILSGVPYQIVTAETHHDALQYLREGRASIVICESNLPDGTWRDVLNFIRNSSEQPLFIVTPAVSDGHLWAEVLNLGGFDVIAKPFRAAEVLHVLQTAYLHMKPVRAAP